MDMEWLRERPQVQEQYDTALTVVAGLSLITERTAATEHDFEVMTAIVGSFAWVLGRVDEAPVTGRLMPSPAKPQVLSEWSQAEAMTVGSYRRPAGLSFRYVAAVEHALAWLQKRDNDPPAQPVSDAGIAARGASSATGRYPSAQRRRR